MVRAGESMPIENPEAVRVICTDEYCSAMILDKQIGSVAVAQMNALENPYEWWVARVLVSKPGNRGKGYGSQVLQAALKAVMARTDGRGRVIVAPGGYDNDNRKFLFYLKNGFRCIDEEGLFEWRQTAEPSR
jgi:GNAT superfamily N-acetyltransferase